EDRAGVRVDVADVIAGAPLTSEVSAVAFVDQREDAAADGDARLTPVAGLLPRIVVGLDLPALLHVQRLTGLVVFEGGALQVHAPLRGPYRRGVRARSPPDPF